MGMKKTIRTIPLKSLASLLLAMASLTLCGCESRIIATGVTRPAPMRPRRAPTPPKNAQVNRMVFVVGSKPLDTDGNGYPDRIEAAVSLFATPYPMPVWEEGRLVCGMYLKGEARMGAPAIIEWLIEGVELERAKALSQVGPQYRFTLSLFDAGTDRLPFSQVDLVCRFEPADGRPAVECDGVRSLQIGRRTTR